MTNYKIQIGVAILGLVCYYLGFLTILQVPTMLMTPTYLAIVLTVPTVIGSLILGIGTKLVARSTWHWVTFSFIFLGLISLAVFILEYKDYENVKVVLDESRSGHYFIIATTDMRNAIDYNGQEIQFDTNNVIYLEDELYKMAVIEPINVEGQSLRDRIKSHMGNQYVQHFYNPSNEEYKLHPKWSTYYHKYQYPLSLEIQRLESLGYNFTDTLLNISKNPDH